MSEENDDIDHSKPYRHIGLLWVSNCHRSQIADFRKSSGHVLYENRPRPTSRYSIEELENMGMKGLWRIDPDNPSQKRALDFATPAPTPKDKRRK